LKPGLLLALGLALDGLAEGRVLHLEVLGALTDARGQALWERGTP
jgi:hypothetical protein